MRISDWSSDVCSSDLSAAPWSSPRKTDSALASLRGSCCLHSSRRSPGPLPLLPNMLPLSTGNGYEHEVFHVAHPSRETSMASRCLLRGSATMEAHTSGIQPLLHIPLSLFYLNK